MKIKVMVLLATWLLIGSNLYAAPGDLAVDGTLTLSVGSPGIKFPDGSMQKSALTTLAPNGSANLANGLIMRWGSFTIGAGTGQTATVTFNPPFPTALVNVVLTPSFTSSGVASYSPYIKSMTPTSFTANVSSWGITSTVYYTAIGY